MTATGVVGSMIILLLVWISFAIAQQADMLVVEYSQTLTLPVE